jgi:hypothetical protein
MNYTVRFILSLVRTFGADVVTDFESGTRHSVRFTVGSVRYAVRFDITEPMIQLWTVDRDRRFGVIVADAVGSAADLAAFRLDAFRAIRRSAGVSA